MAIKVSVQQVASLLTLVAFLYDYVRAPPGGPRAFEGLLRPPPLSKPP